MVTTRSGATSFARDPGAASIATGAGSTRPGAAAAGATASSKPLIRALVTGGAGFLGRHVVQQLLDSGKYEVTVFDIRPLDNPKPHASLVGDLRKPEDVQAAVQGMNVVFHIATAAPTGENALNIALMNGVNVDGTRHLLDACVAANVPRVVYTSSASVVFDGKPLVMADEVATPYASRPMDHYTRTKILGEQLVLEANGRKLADGAGQLSTVALRPSGIFGEGDMVFVPTLVRNARRGKMKYVLGNGRNECDFTYAGNVAHAHLLAADALATHGSDVAGKAYFVTNNEPRPFWTMMGDMCEGLGYARPRIHLPVLLVMFIAMVFEYAIMPLLRLLGKEVRSDFTVNRILIATTNRTFSTARAQKDFGYAPQLGMKEAVAKTLASFPGMRADAGAAAGGTTAAGGKKAE